MQQHRQGRAAVALRLRRLNSEPLCRHCAAKGRITASTVPDHIKPLTQGGTDDDSNIQCLCSECHDVKTRCDLNYRAQRPRIGADGWEIDGD